ncbi:uracil-DNA glycosylase [Polaromonas sp.]|uniref:uracil-DNA glycosylase n=1 Tax=Polaromonas sp. TaxID=1869339 RepID=UPI003BA962C8
MTPKSFVDELASVSLTDVFNPYSDRCSTFDLPDGPALRRRNLRRYLTAIEALKTDTVWMGRDLGYRGGRRTGLALTDEAGLGEVRAYYPGAEVVRATHGPAIKERTATEIWDVIRNLTRPPLLWNVFPLHPHEAGEYFSNRRFTARELRAVSDLNHALIRWLGIKRIVSIGQDAAKYATDFGVEISCVRHPSYGGVRDFRSGIYGLYADELKSVTERQVGLF